MSATVKADSKWKEIITPEINIWTLNIKELIAYKDLLLIWIRRDILSIYTQTILGPLWFFLQPILTTATYVIVFSRFKAFAVDGIPPVLFYISGVILWSYFSDCVTKTSTFFKDSNAIFSKVYFPKLIIPLSIVLTNLIKFAIQFLVFLFIYFFTLSSANSLHPNFSILLFPLLLLMIAALGLGAGLIVSALTTRYKDFVHLITFGIQLLMFLSPVFYPISNMADGRHKSIILSNPMTGIIEAFRYGFTGYGYFNSSLLLYDVVVIIILLFTGIVLFNVTEKKFVDVI